MSVTMQLKEPFSAIMVAVTKLLPVTEKRLLAAAKGPSPSATTPPCAGSCFTIRASNTHSPYCRGYQGLAPGQRRNAPLGPKRREALFQRRTTSLTSLTPLFFPPSATPRSFRRVHHAWGRCAYLPPAVAKRLGAF